MVLYVSFVANLFCIMFQLRSVLTQKMRVTYLQKLLFFFGSFAFMEVIGVNSNSNDHFAVLNITKTSLANLKAEGNPAFVLFYSNRCEECNGLRLDWQKLSRNLKDHGMKNVVVSQVDCCIESDLCDTIDRHTTCLETIESRENDIWTVTSETNLCIQISEEMAHPVFFTTIDECSEMCKKVSSMFAFGTNDLGQRGCIGYVCKCLCINSDDDKTCESINQEQYWFYKFKNVVVTDCSWGSWGAWSGCNSKCTRYRVREMAEERQFGGSECNGLRKDTAPCQHQKCGAVYEFTKRGPNCETFAVVPNSKQCEDAATQLNIIFSRMMMDKANRPAGCFLDLYIGEMGRVYFNRKTRPEETDPMSNDNWDTWLTNKGTKRFTAICIESDLNKMLVAEKTACRGTKKWKGKLKNAKNCAERCEEENSPMFLFGRNDSLFSQYCLCEIGANQDDQNSSPEEIEHTYDCDELPNRNHGNITMWGCQATNAKSDCTKNGSWWNQCCNWKDKACVEIDKDVCVPFSKTACMNASISLGLQLGDKENKFIGNHATKGCYAIEGKAFFGIQGSKVEHRKFILGPLYRPNGYDCDFEACNPNPCLNGGTCKPESPTRFSCLCLKHCNGSNCENCNSAKFKFRMGYPILRLFEKGGEMNYKGPKDLQSLEFFVQDKLNTKIKKNTSELVMEAGCRAPRWVDKHYQRYVWKDDGELLAEGVCLKKETKKHLVPEPGRTKVRCHFDRKKLTKVDSREQTISFDLYITMKWFDPNIKSRQRKVKDEKDRIILSPSAVKKIWTPDLTIQDLTALRFKDEWISLVKSRILGPDDMAEEQDLDSFPPNIEVTYQIKSSVYCKFDHSKYPMDEQKCNITVGSSSFGAIFVLSGKNKREKIMKDNVSNFLVASSLFDNQRHNFGNNTIGIQFTLTHSTTPYFFKYYIPTMAITTISMMGFAFPLTAIRGRVDLVVIQFLTLTNLFIHEMSESPTISDVNGLGVYLLVSLGFVFSALVEFTVIIMLKRRMRRDMNNGAKQVSRKRNGTDVANESKSFECLNDAAEASCKTSKFGLSSNDANKPKGEELDMVMLRRIDFICFFAYLFGYIFFNIYYWAEMMAD